MAVMTKIWTFLLLLTLSTSVVTSSFLSYFTGGGKKEAESKFSKTAFPKKIMGFYLALADDSKKKFTAKDDWNPQLYQYQQDAANVLYFSFINPDTMEVPISFRKLASTRGSQTDGAVPANTVIMFAIGGSKYRQLGDTWTWLTSQSAAESMARSVADWPSRYGCEGIDLRVEEGPGMSSEAGKNLVHFIKQLRQLNPDMKVSQSTFGYPQGETEAGVINAAWNEDGTSNSLINTISLKVYEGATALNYVDNYARATSKWDGFPILINVPKSNILLGSRGSNAPSDIKKLAREAVLQDLAGISVWLASVRNGMPGGGFDSSQVESSESAFVQARKILDGA